jgi:hypothetical protein
MSLGAALAIRTALAVRFGGEGNHQVAGVEAAVAELATGRSIAGFVLKRLGQLDVEAEPQEERQASAPGSTARKHLPSGSRPGLRTTTAHTISRRVGRRLAQELGRPSARGARPAPGARPATGACARESRAIPCRQLPRMQPRSDRGMSQGGWTAVRLGRYLGITVAAVAEPGRAQVLLVVQAV